GGAYRIEKRQQRPAVVQVLDVTPSGYMEHALPNRKASTEVSVEPVVGKAIARVAVNRQIPVEQGVYAFYVSYAIIDCQTFYTVEQYGGCQAIHRKAPTLCPAPVRIPAQQKSLRLEAVRPAIHRIQVRPGLSTPLEAIFADIVHPFGFGKWQRTVFSPVGRVPLVDSLRNAQDFVECFLLQPGI